MAVRAEQLTGNKLGEADAVIKQCEELEGQLVALQVAWEQYFLGLERKPPTRNHERFKKALAELKTHMVRSVAAKVRLGNLASRFVTYDRMWDRTLKEIESGTYRRDLFKARLHSHQKKADAKPAPKSAGKPSDDLDNLSIDEDLNVSDLQEARPVSPPPKAPPTVPPPSPSAAPVPPKIPPPPAPSRPPTPSAPAAPPKPPSSAPGPVTRPGGASPVGAPSPAKGAPPSAPSQVAPAPNRPPGPAEALSEHKIKAIYDAYVMAKRRCGEDTSKLSLKTVGEALRRQVPELMKQHKARSVEFKVVIRDGKAILRAVPKE